MSNKNYIYPCSEQNKKLNSVAGLNNIDKMKITKKENSYPNLSYSKNYFIKKYEEIMLFNEINQFNKKLGYDSLFYWRKDFSKLKLLNENIFLMEINLIIPKDIGIFSFDKKDQIIYSNYLIRELLFHLRYDLNNFDKISKVYLKFLFFRESKKYFFYPFGFLIYIKAIKSLFHIISKRTFIKKNILSVFFCWLSLKLLNHSMIYLEYYTHFNFMANDIFNGKRGISPEKEYKEYIKFKTELFIYEREKVKKTDTIHPLNINNDKIIIYNKKEQKLYF
jgi:hypothetical protein